MAVDIKQLRIGSHISINGERVEVESLQGGDMVGYITPDNDWFATESWRFEPIPITPEMLKELGFEDCEKKRWHTEDWEKRWGDCQYLSFTKLYRGEWRVHYFDGAKDRGQTVVRYLHEAELFLGLHNTELIKE